LKYRDADSGWKGILHNEEAGFSKASSYSLRRAAVPDFEAKNDHTLADWADVVGLFILRKDS
jgi:hypothetical protein